MQTQRTEQHEHIQQVKSELEELANENAAELQEKLAKEKETIVALQAENQELCNKLSNYDAQTSASEAVIVTYEEELASATVRGGLKSTQISFFFCSSLSIFCAHTQLLIRGRKLLTRSKVKLWKAKIESWRLSKICEQMRMRYRTLKIRLLQQMGCVTDYEQQTQSYSKENWNAKEWATR